MIHLLTSIFAGAAILFVAQNQVHAETVTVFAAASLTDSLKQIAADYEKTSGDKIVFNFAASGTLSRQIEAGAPAAPGVYFVHLAAAGRRFTSRLVHLR